MRERVAVIGAGVAGMSTACELASHGIEVYLVEKEQNIGGRALNLSCKATISCQECSSCAPWQLKARVIEHPNIKLIVNCEVLNLAEFDNKYKVDIRFHHGSRGVDLGAGTTLEVDAVVIAGGSQLFDPRLKGEFGYGQHKNVITAFDLERLLKDNGTGAFGSEVRRIGFVQCVGSRTAEHDYCSQVCCMYTAKLARLIRYQQPEALIDIFYLDRQNLGEDDKINYIRALPAKIYRYPHDYLTVRYYDTFGHSVVERCYDLIVLATAIVPDPGLAKFDGEIGLALDRYGFLIERGKPGVFAAGTCTGPKAIPQSIAHAQAVAGRVLRYLNESAVN